MSAINPFLRLKDNDFDLHEAEKFYILIHLDKKWGTKTDNKYNSTITQVIFRGKSPWKRMDIKVKSQSGEFQTVIGEFLEHYHPQGVKPFNANDFFRKEERIYGPEYIQDIKNI